MGGLPCAARVRDVMGLSVRLPPSPNPFHCVAGSMFRGALTAATKGISAAASAAAAAAETAEKKGGWLGSLSKKVKSALATEGGHGGAAPSDAARCALTELWYAFHDGEGQ